MNPRIYELSSNEVTEEKLAWHGLSVDDAFEVFEDNPRYFHQKGQSVVLRQGRIQSRPDRIRMIGFSRSGALCRIILEYPDDEQVAEIVTGFSATADDATRYRRAGGRR